MKRVLTRQQVNELIKDYLKNMYYTEMMAKYKIGYRQLAEIIKDSGYTRPKFRKTVLKPEQIEALRQDFASGIKVSELSRVYGISQTYIYRVCRDLDHKLALKLQCWQDRIDGATLEQLADKHKLHQKTIQGYIKDIIRLRQRQEGI